MACIAKRPNGYKSIQFVGLDGRRQELRLGKTIDTKAESVQRRIEEILSDQALGRPHTVELSKWISDLPLKMLQRLEALGLVKGVSRARVTLGEFLDQFMQRVSQGVKENTVIFYGHTKRNLLEFFRADQPIASVLAENAEEFRDFLINLKKDDGMPKLSKATTSRRIRSARTMFAEAFKRKLIPENPFAGVKAGDQINRSRLRFISREDIQKVLDACPDAQWRLIVSLARFGGVRCPSEILPLKWSDIDWERRRITVHSPKTEHHAGGDKRVIPLFPELDLPLRDAFAAAKDKDGFLITRYRERSTNLRTHFHTIIERAGVAVWPKLWQNLRSTRETELADQYPIQVVCEWIGNSPRIAQKHYLQVTDKYFGVASQPMALPAESGEKPPQNPPQQAPEPKGSGRNSKAPTNLEGNVSAYQFPAFTAPSPEFPPIPTNLMGRAGIEPATQGFSILPAMLSFSQGFCHFPD